MTDLLESSMNDLPTWNNTLYLKPAHDNITYFTKYTDNGNLLNIPSKTTFRNTLKRAMFKELTDHWQRHTQARYTFTILPKWEPQTYLRTNTRQTEGFYTRCSFSQNDTRSYRHKINPKIDPICKRCGLSPETVEHLILHCPTLSEHRTNMIDSISRRFPRVQPTKRNLLTQPQLQPLILQFLNKI